MVGADNTMNTEEIHNDMVEASAIKSQTTREIMTERLLKHGFSLLPMYKEDEDQCGETEWKTTIEDDVQWSSERGLHLNVG